MWSTCGAPSDRAVVVSLAALSPGPGTGMPCARTGGHAAAQAAAQELLPRESLRKRYTVRPRESTSTLPRLPAGSSPMVAGRPPADFGGRGASLPPPQAAMAKAASGTLAAVATTRRDAKREFMRPDAGGAAAAIQTTRRSVDTGVRSPPVGARARARGRGRLVARGPPAPPPPMSEAAADSLPAYVSAPAAC